MRIDHPQRGPGIVTEVEEIDGRDFVVVLVPPKDFEGREGPTEVRIALDVFEDWLADDLPYKHPKGIRDDQIIPGRGRQTPTRSPV